MSQELIDDAFYVKEQKWGTWDSYDKDGKCILTSPNEEQCVRATRWYLKQKQENKLEGVGTKYEGTVGGKL